VRPAELVERRGTSRRDGLGVDPRQVRSLAWPEKMARQRDRAVTSTSRGASVQLVAERSGSAITGN
jgi:hypothetical protein